MAPEQADGARTIDARADVYALGALLFACLTGGPPLRRATPAATLYALYSEPAPLLRSVEPTAPEALERICARALEREREARFDDATSFAAALDAADLGAERARGRTPAIVLAVAGALIAVAALVVLAPVGAGGATAPGAGGAPVETRVAGAPAADPVRERWALEPGARLRYGVTWDETGLSGVPTRTRSVATIDVAREPPSGATRRIEVTWAFEELVTGAGEMPIAMTTHDLGRTGEVVAIVADLDLETGALTIVRDPTSVRAGLSPVVADEFSPAGTFGSWVHGAFGPDPMPRLIALLFARPAVTDLGFTWEARPDREIARPRSGVRLLEPYMWSLDGFDAATEMSSAQGERRVEGGRPVHMWVKQTVTAKRAQAPRTTHEAQDEVTFTAR